MKKHFNL